MPKLLIVLLINAIPILMSYRFGSINRFILPTNHRNGEPPRNGGFGTNLFSSNSDNETRSQLNNIDSRVESDNIVLKRWKELSKETRDDIKTTLVSFIFALLVRSVLIEPRFIPSLSMYPTFDVGDQLLVDKISSRVNRPYKKRDVVVFNPPDTYIELTGNNEALIKRVVAVGGDVVEVKDSHVYVNGIMQEEKYINEQPDYTLPPTKVPLGMLLVLGDNRNHSFDSHIWGFLPDKNIIGRAVVKYWPPWRAGFIEGSE